MIGLFIFMFIITIIISCVWANGIHKAKEEYPDYKGEDFLSEDFDTHKNKLK